MVVGELAESADLLVIGGGPGGYTAAIRAAQLGREVTVIERAGPAGLGGTCLHVGCIPSKALIELADAAQRTRELKDAGLQADGVTVSLERFQAWRDELCASLARGVGDLLARGGVRVVEGRARFNRPDRVAVHTPDDRVLFFEFDHAIVATGSRPRPVPVDALDSTGALALTAVPSTFAVVGADYIGVELATAFAKLGARVTIVEPGERLLPEVQASLVKPVLRRLRRLGVEVRVGTGIEGVEAERILVSAGRVPNTDDLGLEAAGIPVGDDGLLRAGEDLLVAERIAAIGDVLPGPASAHKAMAQGVVAAEVLSGQPAAFDAQAIPVVLFTDPEIASVGFDEEQARAAGLEPAAATFPLAASGRAGTLGARDGFTTLVTDTATDRVIGVHIVGPRASELAAGGALAIELMAAPGDVAATVHPHPTLSEGLHEAAALLLGEPIHVAAQWAAAAQP
jgi:dihydrolipoamide dehydrogenase